MAGVRSGLAAAHPLNHRDVVPAVRAALREQEYPAAKLDEAVEEVLARAAKVWDTDPPDSRKKTKELLLCLARSHANDNAIANAGGRPHPHLQLLLDQEVRDTVRLTLVRRSCPVEIEDGVQEVLARATKACAKNPPTTVRAMCGLVSTIAQAYTVDEIRKVVVRRKQGGELTDAADETARPMSEGADEVVDRKGKMRLLNDLIEQGKVDPRVLELGDRSQAGEKGPEIAQAMGISHQSLRTLLMKARKTISVELAAKGYGIAVLLLVSFSGWQLGAFRENRAPGVAAASAPVVLSDRELLSPAWQQGLADEQQQRRGWVKEKLRAADDAAKEHEWKACMAALEELQRVDPAATAREGAMPLLMKCSTELGKLGNSKRGGK